MDIKRLIKLAAEARRVNVANGWDEIKGEKDWNNSTLILSKLALIHTELSEAAVARTVEEILEELSDVVIRVMDLLLSLDIELVDRTEGFQKISLRDLAKKSLEAHLLNLHLLISEATEKCRSNSIVLFRTTLIDTIVYCIRISDALGYGDLLESVEDKIEYNRTRGYKHGGKRA